MAIVGSVTILPYFATHERTRAAWLAKYRSGQVEFDDLTAPLQEDYAKHSDCSDAWAERYRASTATFNDLPPVFRKEFVKDTQCLDAWVERHRGAALASLKLIKSVKEREIYIPLPVIVGDLDSGLSLDKPDAASLRPFFDSNVAAIAIVGGGGTGKSTLAIQMAKWALTEKLEERLASHYMLPVLVEEETTDLLDVVTRHLKEMADADPVRPMEIDKDIVENALRFKRLLVILDALSERSADTQQHLTSVRGRLPANAMVVTSRQVPDLGSMPVTLLQPQQIDNSNLVYFLTAYLQRTGSDREFPDEQPLILGTRLLNMVKTGSTQRRVTPLLIKLFVEAASRLRKEGKPLDQLPPSVPETILDYLRAVNPKDPKTPNRASDEDMVRAARVMGMCCLEFSFIPHDFLRDRAEAALHGEGTWKDQVDLITRLVNNGVLEQKAVAGEFVLSFNLDPAAEYLAAMFWLSKHRSNNEQWMHWLDGLEQVDKFPQSILGFLVALDDCMMAYQNTFAVSQAVVARIRTVLTDLGRHEI